MPRPFDLLAQRVPATHRTREDRVALLVAAAESLVAGRSVPREAARFLGTALLEWLRDGGRLDARFGVAQRGNHVTHTRIAARIFADSTGASRGEPVLQIPSSAMRTRDAD